MDAGAANAKQRLQCQAIDTQQCTALHTTSAASTPTTNAFFVPTTKSGTVKGVSEVLSAGAGGRVFANEMDVTGPASRSSNQATRRNW